MSKIYFIRFIIILSGLFLVECSTDFDTTAEPKEILVVYGTLNPQQPAQIIKIAQAFLTDGDAIIYAKNNDISIKSLTVVLEDNKGTIIAMESVDASMDINGLWYPHQTIYKTKDSIHPGRTYYLKIKKQGESELRTIARTTVPNTPYIIRPQEIDTIIAPRKRIAAAFEQAFPVGFAHTEYNANENPPKVSFGYEVRLYFNYGYLQSVGDTLWQPELRIGPISMIRDSDDPQCNFGTHCYQFKKREVIDFLNRRIDCGRKPVIRNGYFDDAVRVEVTAIDTFLYNYVYINNSSASSFVSIRPEYTNVVGGVGVFGSINTKSHFVRLNNCSLHLACFNNEPNPSPSGCK